MKIVTVKVKEGRKRKGEREGGRKGGKRRREIYFREMVPMTVGSPGPEGWTSKLEAWSTAVPVQRVCWQDSFLLREVSVYSVIAYQTFS